MISELILPEHSFKLPPSLSNNNRIKNINDNDTNNHKNDDICR